MLAFLPFVYYKIVRKQAGVAGEVGMDEFPSLYCFLLSGRICIFGESEKTRMLAKSWDSLLFHYCPIFVGPLSAEEMLVQLYQSVRLDHFEAVQDADFERTWQDASRAEVKVKKFSQKKFYQVLVIKEGESQDQEKVREILPPATGSRSGN